MLQYMDTFSPRPAAENITNWFPMQFKRQKKQSITERCCQSCQIFPVLPATHHLETRIPEPRRPSYMVPACKTPITIGAPLKAADEKKLTAFEMWAYRRILRVLYIERRSNNFILEKIGMKPILLDTVIQRKLRYFGHIS
ncbi:uncharacterized protein LOC132402980 isoform X3 [Hypanus sabinus]|uniref:uncharacterized protein LOC132402980 isoform X3 n=1 Tax=Hypanus sabinus TaxID=79690 RepID=UPI0028C41A34|nr:uncharacterized protein LOC132402980 isoform X3 [Hypanus sabinus]